MKSINTPNAPKAIGTYSQAMQHGDWVFLSGQIGLDPNTMVLCSDDIQLQINQVMENLAAVCGAAGGSLTDIVKLSVFMTDLNHFALINETMSRYFSHPYPARAAIGVSALPLGAKIEMDGIMVLPKTANR